MVSSHQGSQNLTSLQDKSIPAPPRIIKPVSPKSDPGAKWIVPCLPSILDFPGCLHQELTECPWMTGCRLIHLLADRPRIGDIKTEVVKAMVTAVTVLTAITTGVALCTLRTMDLSLPVAQAMAVMIATADQILDSLINQVLLTGRRHEVPHMVRIHVVLPCILQVQTCLVVSEGLQEISTLPPTVGLVVHL